MKPEDMTTAHREWTLYVDGLSNGKGSGAGVILEEPNDITLEYSLKFDFQATNNQAEYEALVTGLRLAKEVGAETLSIKSDSQLVIAQIKGDYEVKEPLLAQYAQTAKDLLEGFNFNLERIPREENGRADALAKLASAKAAVNN